MLFFLLLLVVCFIVVPLLRVAWYVYRLRRTHRKAWEQFRQATGQQAGSTGTGGRRRKGATTSPTPKKKKIGRDVGEYVEYEDIACNVGQATATGASQRQYHEQQVTDAEWEEIK